MNEPDPYSAPHAPLEIALSADAEGFLGEPRRVATDAGLRWLGTAWRYFTQAPGTWIGIMVVWMAVVMAISLVPIIGGIAANMAMMVMMAGIALACDAQRRGGTPEVSHLFAAFNTAARNPLLVLGLLYLVATMVVAVVMVVLMFMMFGGFAAFAGQDQQADPTLMLPMMAVFFLIAMALFVPLGMAIWFAPPLVAINGLSPIDAMKSSFEACLRNFGVIVIYGIVGMVVTILAMLPLLLGLLVSTPVLMIASYVAYRDIYYAD